MGSGRGDRNQDAENLLVTWLGIVASMGSGRGDRNQENDLDAVQRVQLEASMGSGRGDRNQPVNRLRTVLSGEWLQWGPVVVTGISSAQGRYRRWHSASMGSGRGDRNQVRATGLQRSAQPGASMGSGRGDRNQNRS